MGATQGIRAGRAFVELGVDDRIAKGLQKAERRLKAFGDGLRSLGTRVFAAGAAFLTPILGAVRAFSESGDTLEKMSRRTGVSVEALSELGFAAEQSGADLETLETGLRKMQKSIADAAAGRLEKSCRLGAASAAGHSAGSQQGTSGVRPAESRCAGRTRQAAKCDQSRPRDLPHVEGSGIRVVLQRRIKVAVPHVSLCSLQNNARHERESSCLCI